MLIEREYTDYERIRICDTPGCGAEEHEGNSIVINKCPVCGTDFCAKCCVRIDGSHYAARVCSEECKVVCAKYKELFRQQRRRFERENEELGKERDRDYDKVATLKKK